MLMKQPAKIQSIIIAHQGGNFSDGVGGAFQQILGIG